MNRSRISFIIATAVAGAECGQATEWPVEEETAGGVEEIVVTARKKDESLVDVPISISVVSGEEIRAQGYRDLHALAAAVPAVNLSKAGAGALINVRGVGSGTNPGFEQSVALVVDGVAMGRSRAARAGLLDVERVEVLKGPQTTHFGANTIAGVFNVTTRGARLEETGGYLRASYELEADEAVLEGAVNLPLADVFALRVAGKWTNSEGYIHDTGLGRRIPAIKDKLARLSALWTPSENLRAKLKHTHGQMDANDGLDMQIVNCEPFAPAASGKPSGGIAQFDCIEPNGQFMEDELNYVRSTDLPGSRALRIDVSRLGLEYDVGDVRLASVTGHYRFQNDFLADVDTSSVPSAIAPSRFSAAQVDDAEHFSQELRVSSTRGRLEWTAGLYYQREDALVYNSVVAGFTPPLPPSAARVGGGRNTQESTTRAVFGRALLPLTDRLRVGAGIRYLAVDKTTIQPPATPGVMPADRVANARRFQPLRPFVFQQQRRTDEDLLPSIDLQFDLTANANAYFAFRRGFKAGGYSLANPPPGVMTDYIQTFEPETAAAFELGLKGAFFANRLRANLALFRSNFKDRQVSSLAESSANAGAGITQEVANAAASRSQGMELEFQAQVTERLALFGNLTLLSSKYRDFANAPCHNGQSPAQGCVNGAQDLSGHRTTFAPRHAGGLALRYERRIGGGYRLTATPHLLFTDGYAFVPDFNPRNYQGSYEKINLRVALTPPSQRWELALAGRNLGNEITSHFCQEAATLLTANTVGCAVDPPATFALQASYEL